MTLELPDKTIGLVPDKDHGGGELDPAEVAFGTAVQPPHDPPELGQERMAALHRTTNPPDTGLPRLAPLGRLHPEAARVGPRLTGAIAVGPVRPRPRQVARVGPGHRHFGGGRPDDQGFQDRLGLGTVVDVSRRDYRPQRQAVGVARYVDRSTTLTTIDGRRPRVGAPFFDGFLEPSRRTWSQLIPCSRT